MSKEEIRKKREKWEQDILSKVIARFPERKDEFRTLSYISVKRLYTPEDTAEIDYLSQIGFPGEFPYTRGVQPTMYRGRLWTMRQYAGFATAEESNKRYKYLLEQGQTGLSIAFDLPTQIGYDSDDPLVAGEVGKVGVAIDSLRDMEILFDGIPLDKVSTSMTINSPAAILLAMYIAIAEKQGISLQKLRGTIQNDILKEYVARGTYIFPPKPSMRLITDIFAFCAENLPQWNTISISGYHIREAGSTAVQEIAFTLANGIEYVKAAIDIGLNVDDFASRLSFFFNAHNDILEEVAKFRAARFLWARIMSERFGATGKSLPLRFHTQTAGSSLTAQQPYNNVIRVAFQALAAVLGGTQSLHTNSLDEAFALPSEAAVQIALRTQQIIAHESQVSETIDPLAGSYYVESLTKKLLAEALEYIEKIDKLGGATAAIEQGYIQQEIADSAYRYQKEIESKKIIVVGQNEYATDEEIEIPTLKIDPAIEQRQITKLQEVKKIRDNNLVQEALAALKTAAQGNDNLMPPILKAVKAYATLGEICNVLREVFGEYKAPELG